MIRAPDNVPEYTISVNVPSTAVDKKDITLAGEKLIPAKAKMSKPLRALMQHASLMYAFESKDREDAWKSGLSARIAFAPSTGVCVLSCNDDRIKACFEKLCSETVPIALSEAKNKGLMELKRGKKPSESGNKQIFLERCTLALWEAGVRSPVEFNLNVKMIKSTVNGFGMTTGNLRFPHLLFGLYGNLVKKNRLNNPDLKVCLVGPGFKDDGDLGQCPQLVELKSLLPNARFLILENDNTVLELLGKAIKNQKILYDPATLLGRIHVPEYRAPDDIYPFLKLYKERLDAQVIDPEKSNSKLKGCIEEIEVRLDPSKIELRDFDILTSLFKETDKGQFDVVVATFSISVALKEKENSALDDFQSLGKFLELLREGGVLYMDGFVFGSWSQSYGLEVIKLGIEYLEALTGHRLNSYHYPLKNILPDAQGILGYLPELICKNQALHKISTTVIACIELTGEQVEVSPERKAEIIAKLEKMTKK